MSVTAALVELAQTCSLRPPGARPGRASSGAAAGPPRAAPFRGQPGDPGAPAGAVPRSPREGGGVNRSWKVKLQRQSQKGSHCAARPLGRPFLRPGPARTCGRGSVPGGGRGARRAGRPRPCPQSALLAAVPQPPSATLPSSSPDEPRRPESRDRGAQVESGARGRGPGRGAGPSAREAIGRGPWARGGAWACGRCERGGGGAAAAGPRRKQTTWRRRRHPRLGAPGRPAAPAWWPLAARLSAPGGGCPGPWRARGSARRSGPGAGRPRPGGRPCGGATAPR